MTGMRRGALLGAVLLAIGACSSTTPARRASPTVPSTTASPSPTAADFVRFAAVGDIGDGSENEASVARAILALHRQRPLGLLLLLGDVIYPNGDPVQMEKFRRPYAPLLAAVETKTTLGNHDIKTDRDAFMAAFGMPARYYTFTRGPAQFFAVDSSKGVIDGSQRAWLERALQRSRARWKIVFMHVPVFSSGIHGNNAALRSALQPLFDRYDVSLVLAGHDHDYERTTPIAGTVYVVSGGGCCPRSMGSQSFTARAATGLNFIVVEAGPASLHLEALGPSGQMLDRVTLT